MQSSIVFFCYEKDKPIEIQLEPECILFRVSPNNELKFVGKSFGESEFVWAVALGNNNRDVQLFPDCKGDYEIEVYENGQLLTDKEWYKFM